jgi:ABC-2 type transport system permease protein
MTTLVQIWLIFQRAMRQSLRNPVWVIIGIAQPVLYLTLFGPLLQPLIAATPGFVHDTKSRRPRDRRTLLRDTNV